MEHPARDLRRIRPRRALLGGAAALFLLVFPPLAGQGAPALGAWAAGAAGGTASAGSIVLADSAGGPASGVSSGGTAVVSAGFYPAALLDGDETYCALPGGLPAGSHRFHLTMNVTVAVAATGTLGCLRVRRTDAVPPHWVSGLQSERWWELTGTDSGGAPAAGFDVALTLPYTGVVAGPRACRWTGSSWDCAATASDASTVTRAGVTTLSEWAVGDTTVPVRLTTFRVD